MPQLSVIVRGKCSVLVGKAWRYGAMAGTWQDGSPEPGQGTVSLQVPQHNLAPLLEALGKDETVVQIIEKPPNAP